MISKALVPLLTATAYLVPTSLAYSRSKISVKGPRVKRPELSTLSKSASIPALSATGIVTRAGGIFTVIQPRQIPSRPPQERDGIVAEKPYPAFRSG